MECVVSGMGHHAEKDGADKCPESQAETISLTDSHQQNWKISASSGGTSAASGDVMDGLLECGEKDFCCLLGKAKMLEHQDCDTVRNSVTAAKHHLWQRPKSGMFGN